MARECFLAEIGRERFRCSRDVTREQGCTSVRGPMFISWAVSSYQSNGADCDFSQGISVCLIEILYPIQLGSFVASPPSFDLVLFLCSFTLRHFFSFLFFSSPSVTDRSRGTEELMDVDGRVSSITAGIVVIILTEGRKSLFSLCIFQKLAARFHP